MNVDFAMPQVHIACFVEASIGKSRGPYTLGIVMRAKTRSVDLLIFAENQMAVLYDCWHDDDPRIETSGPEVWEDNTRGTWHLSQGEIERLKMISDLAGVQGRLAALEMAGKLQAEAASEARPAPLDVIKRRPGRPRQAERLARFQAETAGGLQAAGNPLS